MSRTMATEEFDIVAIGEGRFDPALRAGEFVSVDIAC